MSETPWYTGCGITFGILIAICLLPLLWRKHVEDGEPLSPIELLFIVPFTAWWWLPWVLYALTLIPMPPFPPVRTADGETRFVPPTQVEKP